MAEINSETIVSAVLKVLQKKFTTARRYRDTQNQNIIKPCFFVEQLIAPFEKQMGNRLRRSYRIKITYLSDGTHESLSKHLRQVGDKLLEALSFLSLTETEGVFGRSAEYEIVAEELLFTIEYPVHGIMPGTPRPLQSILGLNTDIK